MHWPIFVLLGVAAILAVLGSTKRPRPEAWPVFSRVVQSEPERVLYGRLCAALPTLLVFPQVQLCRFVEVKAGAGRQSVLNRYDRLSVDFVLCRVDSLPLAVIELDDSSHDGQAARARDAKKAAVLAAAGIRLVRWHARSIPDVALIRQEFADLARSSDQPADRLKQVGGSRV